ncbi:undecaprenyl-phosphate glucose phosphotransferase [Aquabacterium sp. OR-4]|uniref:undecaprenyl-phosphate glucose phosphotransferase n=1 Tax=Aquabacterium sp. OR-4 TaxID=2978127 RepID=UPI0021B1EFD3|nr:undecaprenyl-phosphate glucose phosphotransferase [Aquabacterium sp. OR-4]MDT7835843.1 undecaprenyl-phosphate glucose phosphotransferase [Aquabacterium sp. OR-4]
MFDSRSNRSFSTAPPSVTSLIATLLEPAITVLVYLAAMAWEGEEVGRADLTLCFLVIALTWPGINRFGDRLSNAAVGVLSSWITLLAILAAFGYGTRSLDFFDQNVLMFWAVVTPVLQLLAVRSGYLLLRQQSALPHNRRQAVVIGAGALGVKVARSVQSAAVQGIDVVGFFDDRTHERVHAEVGERRVGCLKDAAPFIRANGVKDVYITLPLGSQPRIIELLQELQGTTASIYFVPDVFGISIIQGRLQDIGGVPMVGLTETPFTGTNRLIKRISDIVLALLILVLISPLMAAVAIGVKLSSPGPAVFKQRRNGLDGEEIIVYKFRSMRAMDNGTVVKQATKGDPRITPFGAFIRRTSLDELPQFINVLQGRMSIVGPRPHAVAHNEMYRQLIKAYMVRHKVKPGITGWAQINGHRGETDTIEKMQARVEYDLEYLRNWSLGLDLVIILRTIKTIRGESNAY